MQNSAKHSHKGLSLEFRVKEAVLALVILGMAGSALAWGVYQATPLKAAAITPSDQCRALANAVLGADSEVLLDHLDPADKSALNVTSSQMRAFHEQVLSPRLNSPIALRPMHDRILGCDAPSGIITLFLSSPDTADKGIISLKVKNDKGFITFRYDDLLVMASSLDKKLNLSTGELERRVLSDARAMLRANLVGFEKMHPSSKARRILGQEIEAMKAGKDAESDGELAETSPTSTSRPSRDKTSARTRPRMRAALPVQTEPASA